MIFNGMCWDRGYDLVLDFCYTLYAIAAYRAPYRVRDIPNRMLYIASAPKSLHAAYNTVFLIEGNINLIKRVKGPSVHN